MVFKRLYFFSLIIFSFSIDGLYIDLWDKMFVYDTVTITYTLYIYWLAYLISFVIFCILLRNTNKPISTKLQSLFRNIDTDKLRYYGRLIAFFSVFVGFFNVIRVGDISLMIVNPRGWEKSFGKYFLLNYIYFSHLVAIVAILISCKIKNKFQKIDTLLIILCLISSTFHGVKFTVIHAFSFLIFSVYISSGFKLNKITVSALTILILFLFGFFTFVRGGGVEGISAYISSASVNSLYVINNATFTSMNGFSSFFPFADPDFYIRFYNRFTGGEFVSAGVSADSGFTLNNKYNLTSTITILSLTGPLGFVFWTCILALLLRISYQLRTFFQFFCLVFLLYVILMMFTAWEFYKYKLIFALIIVKFLSDKVMINR